MTKTPHRIPQGGSVYFTLGIRGSVHDCLVPRQWETVLLRHSMQAAGKEIGEARRIVLMTFVIAVIKYLRKSIEGRDGGKERRKRKGRKEEGKEEEGKGFILVYRRSWWQEIEAVGRIVSFLSQETERDEHWFSAQRSPTSATVTLNIIKLKIKINHHNNTIKDPSSPTCFLQLHPISPSSQNFLGDQG